MMIRPIGQAELKEAIQLVNRVFAEFVAVDYSEEGQKTFSDYVRHKYDDLSAGLSSGVKEMWGFFEGDQLAGVIATRNTYHISLLFVDKQFHRLGIARRLFETVREEIRTKGCDTITVNSSPYAVPVYRKLGFEETGPEQESEGIRYIPMKYSL